MIAVGAPRPVGPVAQRLEQATHNRSVPGSNPGGAIYSWSVSSAARDRQSVVFSSSPRD